ncbi:MAG: hypothetical protein AMXMBFR84_44440 [Candidatus Hydrogenedentota bacterium]
MGSDIWKSPEESAGNMRVIDAIQQSIEHAKRTCFPFSAELWLPIGFIAFLDITLTGANQASFSNFSYTAQSGQNYSSFQSDFQTIILQMRDIFPMVLAIGALVFLFLLVIRTLLLYIGCRGQLMFIRAVARNRFGIGENWNATDRQVMSLFWFYLELMLFSYAFYVVLLVISLLMIRPQLTSDSPQLWPVVATLFPMMLLGGAAAFVFAIITTLTRSFVAPIMLHADVSCWEAWGIFRDAARQNWLNVIGFLILRWLFAIALGIASLLVGCVTCCIGYLPVIHHAIFAPYYVLDRSFSLFLLTHCGPSYFAFDTGPPPIRKEHVL